MAAPMVDNVELGFVENTAPYLLKSRFFISKLGGKPAWLSLNPIPKLENLTCHSCGKLATFLLQIYSPVSDLAEAFHRTIFVFICRNTDCCKPNNSDNLRVVRSQLLRKNEFYSSEPPKQVPLDNEPCAAQYKLLCVVCGCDGPKLCSRCHRACYCSREHQTIDWKTGHKAACPVNEAEEERDYPSVLFPEKEIATEPEEYVEEKYEKSEKDKLKEYAEFLRSHKGSTLLDTSSDAGLDQMAGTITENDKQLLRFKKRISPDPEQVLRYHKGGEPLWVAKDPRPDAVPDCSCGSKRQFEFQILPQLLTHLDIDKLGASVDWGTICVYTCVRSCPIGNQYIEEYAFKQDVS